jgi:hypothetical protein
MSTHVLKSVGATSITDITDVTKTLGINLASATTGTTTSMIYSQTADRTWTWPDATSTVTGIDTTQTVTNKTIYEPTAATISAAGTTQGTATALTNMNNVITTVALNTGVSLPVSLFSGLRCTIVNRGANTLNVYPATGAQIDALGANVATTIPVNGFATFESSSATQWYIVADSFGANSVNGTTNQITASPMTGAVVLSTPSTFIAPGSIASTTALTVGTLYQDGTTDTITAAGTTQGTATALTRSYNVVTTVAANTGVVFPTAAIGTKIIVVNRGANTLRVYPATGARIDALAVNAFASILTNGFATYEASTATQWYTITNSVGAISSVSGTTNQVTATPTTGAVVVSTPATFVAPGTITATSTLTVGTFYQDGTVNAITAAGANQAAATGLTRSYNIVTTTAAGTGVRFPTGVIGMKIIVVNRGANTLNVYPATGAQIDALGTNIATTILTNGFATYEAATTTQWYTITNSASGGAVSSVSGTTNQVTVAPSTGAVVVSTPATFIAPGSIQATSTLTVGTLYQDGTTAVVSAAGTTQGTATVLTTSYNVVTTAAVNSGVILPDIGVAGTRIIIVNRGANTVNVYPPVGDTIDGAAANAAVQIPSNTTATYEAASAASWYTVAPVVLAGSGLTATYGNGQTTISQTISFGSVTDDYSASQLLNPNNSNWAVNSLAQATSDPINPAIDVRQFVATPESGVGITTDVPVGATNLSIRFESRAQTAPAGARTVGNKLYTRSLGDNAAIGAWTAGTQLTDIAIPANANYQYQTITNTIASLGLTAGVRYQFEITRVNPLGGTNLTGNWLLRYITIQWS